jgi:polysaccharide export outer membrane protein
MIKKITGFMAIPALLIVCLYSCKAPRELPYFKDLPDEAVSKIASSSYQPLKLQTDDEVQITISSLSPEASQFFNLVSATPLSSVAGASNASQSQTFANLYRVSAAGMLTMPVLGEIQANGLSTEELKAEIVKKLAPFLKDAIVTVRLTNFKVTVIGEVGKPTVVPVNGQNINVLEAIGAAGDMTIYGVRKNVKVLHKLQDGSTEVARLDFNNSSVLKSPYFQLKQNDIVYIQPNKSKGFRSSESGVWLPIVISILSLTASIILRWPK